MIGASKILTVSYGTFSCTLEGFDEPFNTMKAIAEYFRDLAADDRYFGAEPPTPDAAMLHRIAEREIQRRVEAKIQDNGVILRAADLTAPAPAPQTAASPPVAPQPTGLLAEESVAAKLQRIRSAVARSAQPAVAPAVPDVVEDAVYVEDDLADASLPPPSPEPLAAPSFEDEPEVSALPAGQTPLPTSWDQPAEAEDYEPEAEAEATVEQDFPEDLEVASAEDDNALIASLTAASLQADDIDEALPETAIEDALATEDPDAEDLADLRALDGLPSWDAEPEDEQAFEAQPEDAQATVEESFEAEVSLSEDEYDDSDEREAPPVAFKVAPDDSIAASDDGASWPADPEAEVAAEEDVVKPVAEKLRRARARVIKVRRPDVDAPEVEASAPAAEMIPEIPQTAALSPEEEAELQRELDAVEMEADTGRQTEREGRTILEASTTGDEAVNRLLRQTNTEMDGPENRRRMSTLAHLKAAVAATVAELRSPGTPSESGETSRLERYRADLARVVRPRRPGAAPDTDRPAPLVLVSEQRIDAPKGNPAAETTSARILPRRVTSGNLALNPDAEDADTEADAENIFVSSKSFAEFAERLGASELPDLLEAAAAYTACIEGRPHFSRPHLLKYVSEIKDDGEVAREDGLRSFGQLLRQGKIEKVKRGQFAITDNSYYLAEARRMVR